MWHCLVVCWVLAQAGTSKVPEENPVYAVVERSLAAQEFQAAVAQAERLTATRPDDGRAWYYLGRAYALRGDDQEAQTAFSRALEHVDSGPLRSAVLAERSRLHRKAGHGFDAEQDLAAALAADPHGLPAHREAAFLAMKQGLVSKARAHAQQWVALEPESPEAHLLLAMALQAAQEEGAAEEELARARELGADEDSIQALGLTRELPLRLIGACILGGLVLGMMLLLGAGSVLSSITMRSLRSLPPGSLQREATSEERLVMKWYRAVLAFSAVLFYVTLPVLVTGMLLVAPRFGRMMLLAALASLPWLFRPLNADSGGLRLKKEEQPRLFQALAEAAEVARTRPVDRVEIFTDATMCVRETGSAFQVMTGRGERVLCLGLAAVRHLSTSELKSVLAHELGHFSHGETRLGPMLARLHMGMEEFCRRMAHVLNPAYWYCEVFRVAFARILMGHNRWCERMADRAAALAYGGDTFGRALVRVIENGAAFQMWASPLSMRLRQLGRPCLHLYRNIDAADATLPAPVREVRREELLDHKTSELDSHPPPVERIQAVAGVPSARPVEDEPATALFNDFDVLARQMTASWVAVVEAQMRQEALKPLPPVPTTEEDESRVAAAAALCQRALARAEAGESGSTQALNAALARLEEALGAADPALVPTLLFYGMARLRHGQGLAAMATLEHARRLAEAMPAGNRRTQQLGEVDRLLQQAREVAEFQPEARAAEVGT